MKCALLIIDLQKAFYYGAVKDSMDRACWSINTVLPSFRSKGLPVVWIQHIDKDDEVMPGTEGFQFIDKLKPEEGEYHIHKMYGNSFNKTDLYEILKANEVDTVVITGFCAEYCVLSTFRGAMDLDLTPVILKGSLASGKEENIRFVEDINHVISLPILQKILGE